MSDDHPQLLITRTNGLALPKSKLFVRRATKLWIRHQQHVKINIWSLVFFGNLIKEDERRNSISVYTFSYQVLRILAHLKHFYGIKL